MIIVRFADDFVAGFEHQSDARQFRSDLREQLAKFAFELHPNKTRLIEFGRHAARSRAARGVDKPETFDFLGFTHIRRRTRADDFGSSASRSRRGYEQSWTRSRINCTDAENDPYSSRDSGWRVWCEAT